MDREDGLAHGGVGSAFSGMVRDRGLAIAVHSIGVPQEFIEHSKRQEILNDLGLTPGAIAQKIVALHSFTLTGFTMREREEMQLPPRGIENR